MRSFEILIPDPFVSRGEGVYNTIALKLALQELYAFQISEQSWCILGRDTSDQLSER